MHDPNAVKAYVPKQVFGYLQKTTAVVPGLGGSGKQCNDGLDDDGDGLTDYPEDPDCTSLLDPDESGPLGMGGSGGEGGGGGLSGGSGGAGGAISQGGGGKSAVSTASGCDCRLGAAPEGDVSMPLLGFAVAALIGAGRRRRRD